MAFCYAPLLFSLLWWHTPVPAARCDIARLPSRRLCWTKTKNNQQRRPVCLPISRGEVKGVFRERAECGWMATNNGRKVILPMHLLMGNILLDVVLVICSEVLFYCVLKLCMHWQYYVHCDTLIPCALEIFLLTYWRAHGLCDVALQSVCRSVIIARLLYASSAWWWFTSSFQTAAFIRQGVRRGFCPPHLLSIDELVSNIDNKLFNCITSDEHHVLHQLLPLSILTVDTHSDHKISSSSSVIITRIFLDYTQMDLGWGTK